MAGRPTAACFNHLQVAADYLKYPEDQRRALKMLCYVAVAALQQHDNSFKHKRVAHLRGRQYSTFYEATDQNALAGVNHLRSDAGCVCSARRRQLIESHYPVLRYVLSDAN